MDDESSIDVFVVSTTGDDDPPDTVSKFWRRLKRKTNPPDMLINLRFALLGKYSPSYIYNSDIR